MLQTAFTNVTRILREASQILEGGHYAATHVRSVANRLETTWKELATIFDERSSVLALSTLFHQKAEGYKENIPKWNSACEINAVTTDISTLEATIHQHQTLYEAMCQAYTEVSVTRMSRGDLVTFCYRFTPPARSCCISLTILSS